MQVKALMIVLAALGACSAGPARADDLRQTVAADMPGLMAIYRDLHQNPELPFQEMRSAKVMADAARAAGFTVTEKVGSTGVVEVLGNGPGPVVMIRADMDALPVVEQTGLPFASKARGQAAGGETGIMHACGHDTHMTAWIATARLMAARKSQWSGTLVMIGQPAEEIGEGALAMIADGLLTRFPKPDLVIGMHDSADIPSGVLGVRAGPVLASADSIDILVKGQGGHGAYPHLTRDPIVLASAIVMRLQTLVSREKSPFEPAVVTVGAIHGGTKHNIIGDEVSMQPTVRSYTDQSRAQLLDGIRRIVMAEAQASGMPADRMPQVTVRQPAGRATINTAGLAQRLQQTFANRFGQDRVIEQQLSMAGEDFGDFAKAAGPNTESVIFWVGGRPQAELDVAKREGKQLPGLHSPFWAPDAESVISTGAEALASAAMHLMARK